MIYGIDTNVKTDGYPTPAWLFRTLDFFEGPYKLDVAASKENTKCNLYYDSVINGLYQPWHPHKCWCNPPYTNVEQWIKKALEESKMGAKVTCLLPVYMDRPWWHKYIIGEPLRIYAIRGRLQFNGTNAAPFASVAVVFDRRIKRQKWISIMNTYGGLDVQLNVNNPMRLEP